MNAINAIFRGLFDALLAPFQEMSAWVTLLPITVAFSVLALYIFKWTSNQKAMDRVKRQIHASIFEIRLFNDDMRAILRAQFEVLGHVLNQLRLTIIPLLWMLVPILVVVGQLQFHYGYSGFKPGDEVLVKASLVETSTFDDPKPAYQLRAPEGVRIDTPTMWVPDAGELLWRATILEAGDYELEIVDPSGQITTKTLVASDKIVRRSPNRHDTGLIAQIFFPAEPSLPADSAIREITVGYPEATVSLLGWETHWLIAFLIVSVVLAFALRKPLGVTF